MESRETVSGGPTALALDDLRWTALVAQHGRLAFHDPAWARLLADCYGFGAFAVALEAEGRLAAGVPLLEVRGPLGSRRWISLPFTDVCPILAQDADAADRLVAALDAIRGGAAPAVVELRDGARGETVAVTHTLALEPDPDAVFRRFHRSQVQRNVRKAECAGLALSRGTGHAEVEAFYRLHLRTRVRQGTPVQPRRFFELLRARILEQGRGFVSVVRAGSEPVAAAVFLLGGDTVTYKYGASSPGAWSLRPNHLLFWDAIRWSCERGYAAFDFGRTDLANEGLRAFKSGWGATEVPLRYLVLGGQADEPAGRAARGLAAVIRRSPPWVCRAAGELLYRYAA